MKLQQWLTLGGISLGALGSAMVMSSFLPRNLLRNAENSMQLLLSEQPQAVSVAALPHIEVVFLRCGSTRVPEFLAVRGAFSARPRTLAYSAVLIRHPQATFLYDTGLCADIALFLMDQPFFFRQTLGRLDFEAPISQQLRHHALHPADLDFIVLSHLHWDHVAGIPDLPGVPLRINRTEYHAASQGLFERNQGLVRRLMSNNPVDLLDFTGHPYEGFRCSHDLFGDGSVVLVPLPGHTAGQMGMFINRANGARLFLLGDAAWLSDNYLHPATMHPLLWSQVTSDDAIGQQTLIDLHIFACQHPDVPMIGMHDAQLQDAFLSVEQRNHVIHVQ
jgi:glyoxylase-like metal-dependent hydrolase (beta-lactamase superfamily II)